MALAYMYFEEEPGLSIDTPRQTDAIAGLLIAVLAIAALTAFAVWQEWLNLIAGLGLWRMAVC
jgi:hypothetical protein